MYDAAPDGSVKSLGDILDGRPLSERMRPSAPLYQETVDAMKRAAASPRSEASVQDCADGADEPSLGNYTKHVRHECEEHDEVHEDQDIDNKKKKVSDPLRYRLFQMLRGSSYLLRDLTTGKSKQRVTTCRFAVISKADPIEVMHGQSRSWFTGLQVCGSVWSCPCCSDRISQRRREEANLALAYARQNKLQIYMITMTASHQLGDDLAALKVAMTDAWRKMQRRRDWRDLKVNIVGTIRALEVTYGANGWHPHFHMIVIAKSKIKGRLEAMSDAWLKSLDSVGLSASAERGWDVQNADKAGSYLAKFGAAEELTLAGKKRGRRGSRTAFQLLEDYVVEGDKAAGALFRDFAIAFKGSQQLVWSQGLKDLVGVEELDDEELAGDAEDDPELRGLIDYETWRGDRFAGRHGARERRVKILEAADISDAACFTAIHTNTTDEDLWFDDDCGSLPD